MVIVYLLVALLGGAASLFALQNPGPTEVTFLHWHSPRVSLSLLILGSAMVGVLLAALSGLAQQIRLHLRIRQLERRVGELSGRPVIARSRREPIVEPAE